MISPVVDNFEQSMVLKFVNNTIRHVFLTGKAGTGKTTLLHKIIQNTFKKVVVAAPTGVAAINAGGVTLHSLFFLPFGSFIPDNSFNFSGNESSRIITQRNLLANMRLSSAKRKLLQEMELLIIDEVSMLRSDLLDAIDSILISVRRNSASFGGVQLLFIGDLYQLPPVVNDAEWSILKNYYKSSFFFDSIVLQNNQPVYIELDKVYRQKDVQFIEVLNNLRANKIQFSDIEMLNRYYKPNFEVPENENYIKLTTHNSIANSMNSNELEKIKDKIFTYRAEVVGDFNENAFPIDFELKLKKGAQVMFVKNDSSGKQRFYNGKIGNVSFLDQDKIVVTFKDDPNQVTVEKYTWQNVRFTVNSKTKDIEEEVLGTFTHFPIKLAWAITIHKSQGLTFDKAIIDTQNAFAPGQVYVALSRLSSLDGLVLSSPINFGSLKNDSSVHSYTKSKLDSDSLSRHFKSESAKFVEKYLLQAFNFSNLTAAVKEHHSSYFENSEKKKLKLKYIYWATQFDVDVKNTSETAEKFCKQIEGFYSAEQSFQMDRVNERVEAAKEYFLPQLKSHFETINNQIETVKTNKRIKGYLTELNDLKTLFYQQAISIFKSFLILKHSESNTELSKDLINNEIKKESFFTKWNTQNNDDNPKPNEGKSPKIDTKKMSFEAYKSGKNSEEIAKERGLTKSTIEAHLAEYVGLGLVPVTDFISQSQLDLIIKTSKKLDTLLLSEIKHHLGDGVSYTEIKFAMAFYQNCYKEKNG